MPRSPKSLHKLSKINAKKSLETTLRELTQQRSLMSKAVKKMMRAEALIRTKMSESTVLPEDPKTMFTPDQIKLLMEVENMMPKKVQS